jgi:hypothetical protein
MPEPQTYKNHVRLDPVWHFFLAPMFLLNLIVSIVVTIRQWGDHSGLHVWWIVMSAVAVTALGKARVHSLTAQDRVIRLEERLRYARLLSPEEAARAEALNVRQVIALRFASDAEMPDMVRRALAENLTPKQIKESVQQWRPDTLRV